MGRPNPKWILDKPLSLKDFISKVKGAKWHKPFVNPSRIKKMVKGRASYKYRIANIYMYGSLISHIYIIKGSLKKSHHNVKGPGLKELR